MQVTTIATLALVIAFAAAAGSVSANDVSASGKPLTTQQQRMKDCNAQARARSLKGDERKAFMSPCLRGQAVGVPGAAAEKATARAQSPAQLKRRSCGADAKAQGLKGDARKTFVTECVKSEAVSTH